MFLRGALVLISFTSCVLGGGDPRNDGVRKTPSSTKQFNGSPPSQARFPEARVENAYKEWKPVDGGHPMRDPTLLYAPPSLERVVFEGSFSETERSSRSNHEIEDAGQGRSASNSFHRAIVIKAEPSVRKNDGKYSVYGSPDINYSQYYINPPAKQNKNQEETVSPYEAFQREYFGSAVESRSADPFQKYTGPRDDHSSSSTSRHGGGFQYIDPPNKDSYYYYSEDSPYYKAKLSIHPTELYTTPAPIEKKEAQRRNYDVLPAGEEEDASAVVYTFERENGQRQKVGIIFKRDSLDGPQINKVFSSNKNSVLRNPKKYSPSLRPIPISLDHSPPTLRPNVHEPSHRDLVSGKISHVYHGYKYHKKLPPPTLNYPLGNPFAASSVQARPKFFKPQKSPPIFKIAPHRLEGKFGPAIPKMEQQSNYGFPPRRSLRRNDAEPRTVYKTVRDIQYSQPPSIYRVKDSGELYNPRLDTLSAPPRKEARIVLTTEAPWRPDFSDALSPAKPEGFNLLPASTTTPRTPLLKFPHNSPKPKRNIGTGDTEKKPPLVIGFNYDDNPRREEFNEFEDDVAEKSPQELYRLCLVEVPEYLRSVLCPPILEKQSRQIEVSTSGGPKSNSITKGNLKPSVIRSQSKIKVYKPSPSSTTTTKTTPTTTASTTTTASPTTTKSPEAKSKPRPSSQDFISRLSDLFLSEPIPRKSPSSKRIRKKGVKRRAKEEEEKGAPSSEDSSE